MVKEGQACARARPTRGGVDLTGAPDESVTRYAVIIRQLVEFPDEIMLSEIPTGRTTIFKLQMRQSDVGKIIGRNGQTIHAIRALLASSAGRHGQKATLEIVE